MSTSTFFRLCSRAPRTRTNPLTSGSALITKGALHPLPIPGEEDDEEEEKNMQDDAAARRPAGCLAAVLVRVAGDRPFHAVAQSLPGVARGVPGLVPLQRGAFAGLGPVPREFGLHGVE